MPRKKWPWTRGRFRYLITATNRLEKLRRKLEGRDELAIPNGAADDYLRTACSAIRRLAADENFRQLTQVFSSEPQDPLLEPLIANLDRVEDFLDEFKIIESREMKRAGLDAEAIETMMGDRAQLLAALRNTEACDEVLSQDRLNRIEKIVCSKASYGTYDAAINVLQNASFIAGGGAIIVTNFTGEAALGGIATGLSFSLGKGVAAKGVRGLYEKFWKNH